MVDTVELALDVTDDVCVVVTVDVTVDVAVVTRNAPASILLIRRLRDPFRDTWALPGGFVDENEALDTAAYRELVEETGLDLATTVPSSTSTSTSSSSSSSSSPSPSPVSLHQVGAFGDPGRDPRGWTVSIAYVALVDDARPVEGQDDAAEAKWWPLTSLPPLAFDHAAIIRATLRHLTTTRAAAAPPPRASTTTTTATLSEWQRAIDLLS